MYSLGSVLERLYIQLGKCIREIVCTAWRLYVQLGECIREIVCTAWGVY